MKRKPSFRVGSHFRYLYRDQLNHVVAITPIDGRRLITYRWYSYRHGGGWRYEVQFMDVIDSARFAVRGAHPLHDQATDQLPLPMPERAP